MMRLATCVPRMFHFKSNKSRIFPALALAVAGCDAADNRVCGQLAAEPPMPPQAKAEWRQQQAAYCVEHWAARLAPGPDAAPVIAASIVRSACRGSITAAHEAWVEQRPGAADTLESITQGWKQRAIFIISQVRAGRCYPNA